MTVRSRASAALVYVSTSGRVSRARWFFGPLVRKFNEAPPIAGLGSAGS